MYFSAKMHGEVRSVCPVDIVGATERAYLVLPKPCHMSSGRSSELEVEISTKSMASWMIVCLQATSFSKSILHPFF